MPVSNTASRRIRRTLGVLAAPLPVLVLALPVAHAATPARTALAGTATPHLASDTVRTGAVAANAPLTLEVSLTPRNQAGLDAFLRQVSDPASPQYKHYLTVAQYAAAYGATDAQISQVTKYLRGQGLSVGAVTDNHQTIAVQGTAAQAEKAFGVQLGTWRSSGRDVFANTAAPSLPTDIASIVSGVAGLSNVSQRTASYHVESPSAVPHAGTVLTPTKARGGYNLTGPLASGDNGSGKTVGLVEFSAYSASAVSAYNTKYSLGAPAATVVKVAGGTTDTSGSVEDELDIEVVNALAPKANVKVYEAPNSDAGEVALYAALVSADVPVISSSWGEPENEEANLASDDADFKEAAAQGQSVFAASGDSGARDDGSSLSVDYPASDPYVSGVGGTNLTVSSANAWSSETGWSGSGGGQSDKYTTPSYQAPVNTSGHREVPDVAAAAGNSSPWYIDADGSWTDVWGTSAAAPNWAAFVADYDTAATKAGKASFGYANSFLYTVAGSSSYTTVFHDIKSGNNGGYSAGTGYDEVTGWGSYNAAQFIATKL
ncbi:Peptidase S53 propeptide [Catenulispora acidiphila DSM 44928]|uniref:Peptidase S53 propeptide n=1 Tax=Catenulispora acidiphila (strain DSM 44928 / JCM 14897 / NBRC 102108 / NRRL B-24433 / ID139908) TaxID=479433 RepID=C7Q7T9_CATAD|nr:S53 family peptidase [Catenulispora acidiphila]ACU72282.1 Peptidase S53 propeptide [Catenulispora acidiphila DSM 44928]